MRKTYTDILKPSYIIEEEIHITWVHSLDEGGVPAKMPRKYALELVCDYLAAGRTYNKDFTYGSEYNWWIKFLSSPRTPRNQGLRN